MRKADKIFSIIQLLSVVIAFILWYIFALREINIEDKKHSKQYIDINTNKSGITIKKVPENIYLRVNGEIFQSGSIDLD